MFSTFNGLPLHPLVVHAIVVLLPLATLGTLLIAVRPGWRVRYGPLVVAAALVSTVLIPVATSSGENLEKQVGDPGQHAQLGDQLLWFALALLITSAVFVATELRRERAPTPQPPKLFTAWAVLAVVAALACSVQVYRVGDSGARAAWGGTVSSGQ
ncbi:DUF2231 domain-containing protein [Nocardioides sp.]|jgi:hypothetical protein|uniref:DUF2231 domain-containing protein n=1 Tax=Nocardioides sp. TaxID=35761 RepID=UPI0031FE617E|nr:hypothetical protein [Nocardioides sp.]